MQLGPTTILDTHAEAFAASYVRLLITAADPYWLDAALASFTGYGTSVIGCDAEVGVENFLSSEATPDGRPGAAVLLFAFTSEAVGAAAGNRVGQSVLTCPTTACFDGSDNAAASAPLGSYLRYFGDGHETRALWPPEFGDPTNTASRAEPTEPQAAAQTLLDRPRIVWRIPVMEGEFLVEETAGVARGVAGGNLILHAASPAAGLAAGRRAAEAIARLPGVIAPFPGGVCRSGSKVGSKYSNLVASTNEAYCPSLRDCVETRLVPSAAAAYEIIIDGVDAAAVARAMREAALAAAGEGLLAIGAGNYGGQLGKYQFPLRDLLR